MIVNFDFLDTEPIENVITNLNFKVDRTVYFGYSDVIRDQRPILEGFLKEHCDGQDVDFIALPRRKLKDTLEIMREAVTAEKEAGNKVFFDITGGDSLPMVAFGILSTETDTPMHIYNIERNRLMEQDEGAEDEISKMVARRNVDFNIDMYMQLRGCAVSSYSKSKNPETESDIENAEKLIEIFERHSNEWTRLTAAVGSNVVNDGDGYYHVDYNKVADMFYPGMVTKVKSLMSELDQCGLVELFPHERGIRQFTFKNNNVRQNIIEEGAALEIKTCLELREKYSHVKAGVAVDWNDIHNEDIDVMNEIDIMALDGFTPIIVSCKCGNQADRDALYELDTVAKKFGGKYAKKVFVSAKNMTPVDKRRASEMGIDVQILNKDVTVKNYND